MMAYVLASDSLAPWGQAAAIILAIYLFFLILVGLGLAAVLMFGFAWLRQKAELLRQVRPQVKEANQALLAARQGLAVPERIAENPIMSRVVQVPNMVEGVSRRVERVEQTVDHGSQRVADVVIEVYARAEMVKGMARAFFLPGLTRARKAQPLLLPVLQETEREREREQAGTIEEPVRPREQAQPPQEEPPMEQVIVIRR